MSKYTPDYPSTLKSAIEMLTNMHDRDNHNSELMNGYRMGLRLGINFLKVLAKKEGEIWDEVKVAKMYESCKGMLKEANGPIESEE